MVDATQRQQKPRSGRFIGDLTHPNTIQYQYLGIVHVVHSFELGPWIVKVDELGLIQSDSPGLQKQKPGEVMENLQQWR